MLRPAQVLPHKIGSGVLKTVMTARWRLRCRSSGADLEVQLGRQQRAIRWPGIVRPLGKPSSWSRSSSRARRVVIARTWRSCRFSHWRRSARSGPSLITWHWPDRLSSDPSLTVASLRLGRPAS